jgi:hypothetical protein
MSEIFNPLLLSHELRNWLATKTLGGVARKGTFQYYDKHLWLPVRNHIESILEHSSRTPDDLELLSCCYTGELFRVQNYNERARSYVYPLGCYQSWATENGLTALSSIGGQVLVIHGYARPEDYAIRTIDLMVYMQPEIWGPLFSGTHELSRYCREHEVAMPITKKSIVGMYVVEAKDLANWRNCGIPLAQEKWFRNNW